MIVRKLLVYCIIPLFLTYQWQQLMQSYYFTRQDFPKRDKLQHDLSLFSEGGFYYSFYEQFALADSWGEAFQLLFRDKISEYPDTINALGRFNIYPELFVGMLYRVGQSNSSSVFGPLLGTTSNAADFYYRCVFLWNGSSMGSLFLAGYRYSGTMTGGFLSALLFAIHYKFGTQVQWSPTLRECWALPCFHLLMFLIIDYFKTKDENVSSKQYVFIGIVTFLTLLPWQFTPFMFLGQSLSILLPAIVGFISFARIAKLFKVYLIAIFSTSIALFGQISYFHSFVFCLLVAVYTTNEFEKRKLFQAFLPSNRYLLFLCEKVVRLLSIGVLFIGVLGTNKLIFDRASTSHVSTFMKFKFQGLLPRLNDLASGKDSFTGGPPPDFSYIHDFDTLMYVCQTEFDFMPVWAALNIFRDSLLIQVALVSFALVTLLVLGTFGARWLHFARHTPKKPVATKAPHPQKVTDSQQQWLLDRATDLQIGSQAVAFCIIAITVERFSVLMIPSLVVLSSFIANDVLILTMIKKTTIILNKFMKTIVWNEEDDIDWKVSHATIGAFLLGLLAMHNWQTLESIAKQQTHQVSYVVQQQAELMRFIRTKIPNSEKASFSASMPLASAIRFTTGKAITMHPQYESAETRRRIRQVYEMYGLKSLTDIHSILKYDIQTKYFVFEIDYCNGMLTNGCKVVDMVDEYNHFNRWKVDQLSCIQLQKQQKSTKKLFKQLFKNNKFIAFEIL